MARAIPRALGIIPSHCTAQMCAGSRECVRLPVHIFPDGKFLLSALDHATLTNWDSFDVRDARLSVAALVEALWRPTRWIKDRRPRIGLAANLVGQSLTAKARYLKKRRHASSNMAPIKSRSCSRRTWPVSFAPVACAMENHGKP